jgi:hypothetical protein
MKNFVILDALGVKVSTHSLLLHFPERGRPEVVMPSSIGYVGDKFMISGQVYPAQRRNITIEVKIGEPDPHIYVLKANIGDLM